MTGKKCGSWPVLTKYDQDHLTHIALPLGGIGTGTVSLGGRGDLRDWEIVNRPAKNFSPKYSFFSIYIENVREIISKLFNISLFPEEIYFLSKMPSEINFYSILLIGFCSIIATTLVSIYPAIKASNLDPVKSLKYD